MSPSSIGGMDWRLLHGSARLPYRRVLSGQEIKEANGKESPRMLDSVHETEQL